MISGDAIYISHERYLDLRRTVDQALMSGSHLKPQTFALAGVPIRASDMFPYTVVCEACGGQGDGGEQSTYCRKCRGSGEIRIIGMAVVIFKTTIIHEHCGEKKFAPSFPRIWVTPPKLCRGLP